MKWFMFERIRVHLTIRINGLQFSILFCAVYSCSHSHLYFLWEYMNFLASYSNFIFFLRVQGEKEYYERQFSTLRSFEEVDSTESSNVIEDGSVHAEQVQSERAMKISNLANVLLLAFKVPFLSFLIEL